MFAFKKWFLNSCNSLKTHNSVTALEILLVARSKTKTITVVAMMETQLMLFHQWNQLLKQLKLPRLCQPQLQLEKSKRELNHQVISKIKTINHQGRSHSIYHHRFPYCLWPVIDKDTEWNRESPIENESDVKEASTGNSLGNIGETNVNFVQNEIETDSKVDKTEPEDKLEKQNSTSLEINIESSENDILDLAWLKLK